MPNRAKLSSMGITGRAEQRRRFNVAMWDPTNAQICSFPYNGWARTKVHNGTNFIATALNLAQACGTRVIVKLHTNTAAITAIGGGLDLALFDAQISPFVGNIESYIANGTIAGHWCIDEPHDASDWGGVSPSVADCEAACALSKSYWPTLRTIVSTLPNYADDGGWNGETDEICFFYANSKGDLQTFVNLSAALIRNGTIPALSWGIQAYSGGDGGAAMTPARVRECGRTMGRTRLGDVLHFGRYDAALLSAEMLAAIDTFEV